MNISKHRNTIFYGPICKEYKKKVIEETCKGVYQENLLNGSARWSGADLKGKASEYSSSYAESRSNLISRLKEKFDFDLYMGYHPENGKKQLLISAIPVDEEKLDEFYRKFMKL